MSLILPAEPKEQEAGVESMGTTATKRRKFPTGIAPPEMKELSKSFEILSNSGLRNPGLVKVLNLTCKHDLYGLLAALLCCVKAYNKSVENKNDSLTFKALIIIDMTGFNFRPKSASMHVSWPFSTITLDQELNHTGYNYYTLGFV